MTQSLRARLGSPATPLRRAKAPFANQAAFTLIEVLIALAILAIALSASMRTLHLATDSAADTRQRTLATWIAQNRLAEHQARRTFPPPGSSNGELDYAGHRFAWQQTVTDTPNPSFRKIELRVTLPGNDHALAQLTGYLVQATK